MTTRMTTRTTTRPEEVTTMQTDQTQAHGVDAPELFTDEEWTAYPELFISPRPPTPEEVRQAQHPVVGDAAIEAMEVAYNRGFRAALKAAQAAYARGYRDGLDALDA